jgi:hypothetical protein
MVDIASGKAKVADTDPSFMADRSIVPVWSPDSRYMAYPKRLKSLFRAIFVYDAETGAVKQITDGLADATAPAWDAGGKYLWFLASTNFALNSSLHSYLILAYSDDDDVALDVGFYYSANAAGRLVGTLLSGVLYLWGGLDAALWGSAAFVAVTWLLTLRLPPVPA